MPAGWKPALPGLLVGQGFDGVYAGGAEGGDGGAEGGADEGEADGTEYPAWREKNGEAGIGLLEDSFGEEGDADAEKAAGDGKEGGFTEKHFDHVEAGES